MPSLELYLDESGHSSNKPYVIVAGYIAPSGSWRGFGDEWNAALISAGVVRANDNPGVFHMTDFESCRGAFTGWTREKQKALMGTLMGIIDRHGLYATGFAVDVNWWNTSIDWKKEHPEHEAFEDPYLHALQNAIFTALDMTKQPEAPPLHNPEGLKCVIAQQGEFQRQASAYMAAMTHFLSSAGQFLSIDFGVMDEHPQLQAADIVAFELRWRLTRPDISRWPMRQIINSGRGHFAGLPTGVLASANLGPVHPMELPM